MNLLGKYFYLSFLFYLISSCSTVEFTDSSLNPNFSLQQEDNGYFSLYMDNLEKLAISDVSISVKPNIPLNQDFRFRKCYKFLTPEEPILAIINSTISFNLKSEGCYGSVFTNKGIHSNPSTLSMVQGKHFIPYDVLLSPTSSYSDNGQGIIINAKGYLDLEPDTNKDAIIELFTSAYKKYIANDYIPYVIEEQNYIVDQLPDEVIQIINSLEVINLYSSPQISWDLESRFRDCTGLHGKGNLLLFFPSTDVYKPGCYGAGFTDSGLYISNNWGSDFPGIYFLSYDFLFSDKFNPSLNEINNSVILFPGLEFDLEGVSTNIRKPTNDFLNILTSFQGQNIMSVEEINLILSEQDLTKSKKISAFDELNKFNHEIVNIENKYKAIGNIIAATILQSKNYNASNKFSKQPISKILISSQDKIVESKESND